MEVRSTPMTVTDYCIAFDRNEIIINKKYQRSDQVWPSQARSFLIETLCNGYPVPKFILNQVFDGRSRQPVKEIVDGQQRTKVITDFYNNALRLSKTLANKDIAGKIFDELAEELQVQFLNCSLDIDLFVGASFADVVEAFRRLNSYTFPLNAAEKRHARYQRGFKWFIFYFCRRYEPYLRTAGVFTDKALVRMLDTTLVAEIWDALERGIRTTKAPDLDKLYKSHDVDPFDAEPFSSYLSEAFDILQSWGGLYNTALCKQYMTYALALAIIHVCHDVESLRPGFRVRKISKLNTQRSLRNLTTLSTAFDAKDVTGSYKSFVEASTEKTNVESQRKMRFKWFCEALTQEI
jgi:hypothetical protein